MAEGLQPRRRSWFVERKNQKAIGRIGGGWIKAMSLGVNFRPSLTTPWNRLFQNIGNNHTKARQKKKQFNQRPPREFGGLKEFFR